MYNLFMTCCNHIHDFFTACSQFVHKLTNMTYSKTCSWTCLPHSWTFIPHPWIILELSTICSWLVHNLFMTCAKFFHDLFTTYSWLVHELLWICSKFVYYLYMTCDNFNLNWYTLPQLLTLTILLELIHIYKVLSLLQLTILIG